MPGHIQQTKKSEILNKIEEIMQDEKLDTTSAFAAMENYLRKEQENQIEIEIEKLEAKIRKIEKND
jgi:uncharacterized protein YdiU (UPF0061 family)